VLAYMFVIASDPETSFSFDNTVEITTQLRFIFTMW